MEESSVKVKSYYWEEINQRAYEEEITGLRQPEAHYALEEAHRYYNTDNEVRRKEDNHEMQSM